LLAERIKVERTVSDPLSALAPLLRVRHVEVQDLCVFANAWKSPHAAQAAHWAQFHVVLKGSCCLEIGDGETRHLRAGSLLLLPLGDPHVMRSSRRRGRTESIRTEYNGAVRIRTNTTDSSDTELVCGRLQFDPSHSDEVVNALPQALVLDVSSAKALSHMRSLIEMIGEELKAARAGARAIASNLSTALFVSMLREHFEQTETAGGLLSLLRSPVCAKAVKAITADPSHDWTLDALAQISHVSRATLVRSFQKTAAMAPLAFLAEVRLGLARERLASTAEPVLQIAAAVGYSSESAFVRAFKRRFGISPGKLRSE
jgi:AraC family transcriptional activator of mtrCDE